MTTQLSINVNDETAKALVYLADEGETSVTEIIRRAVGTYVFLKQKQKKGHQIIVKSWWPNPSERLDLL